MSHVSSKPTSTRKKKPVTTPVSLPASFPAEERQEEHQEHEKKHEKESQKKHQEKKPTGARQGGQKAPPVTVQHDAPPDHFKNFGTMSLSSSPSERDTLFQKKEGIHHSISIDSVSSVSTGSSVSSASSVSTTMTPSVKINPQHEFLQRQRPSPPLMIGPPPITTSALERLLSHENQKNEPDRSPPSPVNTKLGARPTGEAGWLQKQIETAQKEIDAFNANGNQQRSLKNQILLLPIEISVKASIVGKLDEIGDRIKNPTDHSKFVHWVKDITRLPFNKTVPLPCTLDDGPVAIKQFLDRVRHQLDAAIVGQTTAKEEIIDFVARVISNPNSRGNVLALTGPKGCGKTRLVRRGIAEALQRPFHTINLGGMNDVHIFNGHDFTYSSSKYGRLSHILIQSQCENPVIYLDEIDKIQSKSDKGMEIFRVLTHILDDEQNHEFHDDYFTGITLNLSKILFVCSMNDADLIDPVLRDRLKLVPIDALDVPIKLEIVQHTILPELYAEMNFPADLLEFDDDTIKYILFTKTEQEDGCRLLKRNMETVIQKINTIRVVTQAPSESDVELGAQLARQLSSDAGDRVDTILKNGKIHVTRAIIDLLLKTQPPESYSFMFR